MATVMIVFGAVFALFGVGLLLTAWLTSAPASLAFFGLMWIGLGGVFVGGQILEPGGLAYTILSALGVLALWAGWRYVKLTRREAEPGERRERERSKA